MAENSELHNPWLEDGFSCPLKQALILGENTGHIAGRSSDSVDASPCISLQLISVLRSISDKRKACNKMKRDIQHRMLDKETSDITHLDILNDKVRQIEELNNYLQQIVDEKQTLITRVQQPLVGDHIKLHASHHTQAADFFKRIAPILSDLPSNLENLDWVSKQDFNHAKLDSALAEVAATLAGLQKRFNTICGLRNGIEQRYRNSISTHT